MIMMMVTMAGVLLTVSTTTADSTDGQIDYSEVIGMMTTADQEKGTGDLDDVRDSIINYRQCK